MAAGEFRPVKGCLKCAQGDTTKKRQIYEYVITKEDGSKIEYAWDVTKGLKMAAGRGVYYMLPEDIDAYMIDQELVETPVDHTDHVDWTKPGLVMNVLVEGYRVPMLVDGRHRAKRCRRDNYRFHVWMLDADETDACIMQAPGLPIIMEFESLGEMLEVCQSAIEEMSTPPSESPP